MENDKKFFTSLYGSKYIQINKAEQRYTKSISMYMYIIIYSLYYEFRIVQSETQSLPFWRVLLSKHRKGLY